MVKSKVEVSGDVTLEGLASIVAGLAKAVEDLTRHQTISTAPTSLPRARSTREILAGMKVGETRFGRETIDQGGGFKPDDVIELTDEAKLMQWRRVNKVAVDEPMYGVVQAFMYRKSRSGERKYRVDFGPGIGDDGLMEGQMKLVRAA